MNLNKIDIKENAIREIDSKLLEKLLIDRTTRKNIIWATSDYTHYGEGYAFDDEITVEAISGNNGEIIKPRIEKSKAERTARNSN